MNAVFMAYHIIGLIFMIGFFLDWDLGEERGNGFTAEVMAAAVLYLSAGFGWPALCILSVCVYFLEDVETYEHDVLSAITHGTDWVKS